MTTANEAQGTGRDGDGGRTGAQAARPLRQRLGVLPAPVTFVTFGTEPVPGLPGAAAAPDTAFEVLVSAADPLRITRAFQAAGPGQAALPVPFAALQGRIFGDGPPETTLVARFADAATLARFAAARRGFLRRCAALLLHAPGAEEAAAALAPLRGLGFGAPTRIDEGDAAPGPLFLAVPTAPAPAPGPGAPAEAPGCIPDRRLDRLVILDPCLEKPRGHFLPLARSYSLGAQALGATVVWACHEGFQGEGVPAGVQLRPCFRRSYFDVAAEDAPHLDLSAEMAPALHQVLREAGGPGTHALAHSADPALVRAALRVAEELEALPATLHLCIPNHPWMMPGAAAGMDPLEALAGLARTRHWNRSIFLWAETRTVAAELGRRLGQPVPALPLPAPAWASAAPPAPAAADGPLALAFLGEARLGKGFLDLPELAAALEAMPELAGRVELRIHALPPHNGFTGRHRAALTQLGALRCVRLHEGPLDEAGYHAFLRAADAVLLPYSPKHYNGRGSGILCDAIAAGRVVVARASATMAEHAEEGVLLAYRNPAQFAALVAGLLADRAGHAARAAAEAPRFLGRRHPVGIVAALRDRLAFAAPQD